jgi:hypothetical protein
MNKDQCCEAIEQLVEKAVAGATPNPNVALTVVLDADRKGLLLLTADGQELQISVGPNTGDTIRDWLLINERRLPRDEQNTQSWHNGDATGRLTASPNTISDPIEEYTAKGGRVTKLAPRSRAIHYDISLGDIGL